MEQYLKEYIPWKSNDAKVIAVHPNLLEELKIRKELVERETERPTEGGITAFSGMAALELKLLRQSSDKIINEVLHLKELKSYKVGERHFIPYDDFKRLLMLLSVLNRKKDQSPIKIEITKIRGLKKNEMKYLW